MPDLTDLRRAVEAAEQYSGHHKITADFGTGLAPDNITRVYRELVGEAKALLAAPNSTTSRRRREGPMPETKLYAIDPADADAVANNPGCSTAAVERVVAALRNPVTQFAAFFPTAPAEVLGELERLCEAWRADDGGARWVELGIGAMGDGTNRVRGMIGAQSVWLFLVDGSFSDDESDTLALNPTDATAAMKACRERVKGGRVKIASMRDPAIAAAVRRGDPGYIYVGRSCTGLPRHPLANPYKLSKHHDRRTAILKYAEFLRFEDYWGRNGGFTTHSRALDALKPTDTLVCWCASCTRDPYPDPENHADGCHADVIARVWAEREGGAA